MYATFELIHTSNFKIYDIKNLLALYTHTLIDANTQGTIWKSGHGWLPCVCLSQVIQHQVNGNRPGHFISRPIPYKAHLVHLGIL